ncbi:hypothetical protein PUN28_006799 [Cardiocondyla obscurior]|uniref:Uncharacterized protein n=1 Tax=Cardiocondyla obscurior TaxID=286306 RepID=A0AAW2G1S2_9HYME
MAITLLHHFHLWRKPPSPTPSPPVAASGSHHDFAGGCGLDQHATSVTPTTSRDNHRAPYTSSLSLLTALLRTPLTPFSSFLSFFTSLSSFRFALSFLPVLFFTYILAFPLKER